MWALAKRGLDTNDANLRRSDGLMLTINAGTQGLVGSGD